MSERDGTAELEALDGPPESGSVAAEPRRAAWRAFLRKPVAVISLGWVLVCILAAVFASVLAPYGPNQQDLLAPFAGPSSSHLLGTGALGLDILSRLMYGGRATLLATAVALAAFVIPGVPAGMIAGYKRGRIDQFVLKLADIAFSIPQFIILLVVLAIFPNDELLAMAVWGVLNSPGIARVVRSATLGISEELYVRASLASGIRDRTIIARHVFPQVLSVIIIQASTFASGAVITESGLGLLGLGTQRASWGNLLAEASQNFGSDPWLLVPSGLIVITFILAVNLLGDGIRDTLVERHTPVIRRRRTGMVSRFVRSGGPDASAVASRPSSVAGSATVEQIVDTPPTSRDLDPASQVPADSVLAVRGLSVAIPIDGQPTEVVRQVSFGLRAGETLGIVGESGCGKTITAVSMIGLVPAGGSITSGSVMFDGVDLTRLNDAELRRVRGGRIGWITQDPTASLDPVFTVGHQVAEVVRTHHRCPRSEARDRTIALFERVKLPEPERVFRSYPHQLSGGMAQRVGIAAAIAGDPVLIIADEPTTALDVTVQAEILDLLRDLQADGTAIILITHDWGVLADVCERAAVMYAGEIVEQATVTDLIARPAHPYTAALLRSDPHNSAPGQPIPMLEGVVPPPTEWPVGCHFQNRCPLAEAACCTGPIAIRQLADASRQSRCIHTTEVLQEHAV